MRLLVTMKLSDRSLENHILPITKLKEVEEITVVRNRPGSSMEKVSYIAPSQHRASSPLLELIIKMIQIVRSSLNGKPCLIHSYLLFPHGYLAFIVGKITRRKVGVSLIAGPVELFVLGGSPIGKYSYCHPLPPSNLLNVLALSILGRFDIITVTGSFTKNYLVSNGIDEKKIVILPHVVDERFRPMDVKKDYDVIFVGRLAPVKHVEVLVKATEQIKKALPSIRVAIVGDGEERGKLETLTRSFGLTENIEFVGYQDNTWEWYNRSKISVLTSEREGFPYTVIESLKCGVPVVASRCGDIVDIIEDNENGALIDDYSDYKSYAQRIIRFLNEPKKIAKFRENALLSVSGLSSHSVEMVWEQILSK